MFNINFLHDYVFNIANDIFKVVFLFKTKIIRHFVFALFFYSPEMAFPVSICEIYRRGANIEFQCLQIIVNFMQKIQGRKHKRHTEIKEQEKIGLDHWILTLFLQSLQRKIIIQLHLTLPSIFCVDMNWMQSDMP